MALPIWNPVMVRKAIASCPLRSLTILQAPLRPRMGILSTFAARLAPDLSCLRRNQTAGMFGRKSLGVQQPMVTRPRCLDRKDNHSL
jgi:hypothetical protein